MHRFIYSVVTYDEINRRWKNTHHTVCVPSETFSVIMNANFMSIFLEASFWNWVITGLQYITTSIHLLKPFTIIKLNLNGRLYDNSPKTLKKIDKRQHFGSFWIYFNELSKITMSTDFRFLFLLMLQTISQHKPS